MLVNALSILVGDVTTMLDLGFTHIEIWESKTYDADPVEITSSEAEPAALQSNAWEEFSGLAGLSLVVEVDGVRHTVEFSPSLGAISAAQLASLINAVVPDLAMAIDAEWVGLTSPTDGRASHLVIVSQPPNLFPTTQLEAFGTDGRLALVDDQKRYVYHDMAGTEFSRYRWRFSANGDQPVSKFSAIVSGTQTQASDAPIAVGSAAFTSLDGAQGKVTAIVSTDGGLVGSYTVSPGTKTYESDEGGFLAIPFVQGLRVTVAFEQLGIVKTFTVPATDFDLLRVMSDAPDQFTVQAPAPLLTKRSIT